MMKKIDVNSTRTGGAQCSAKLTKKMIKTKERGAQCEKKLKNDRRHNILGVRMNEK